MCLLQLPRSAWELIPYAPRHRAAGPYKTMNGRGAWERSMRAAPRQTPKHLGARVPVSRPSGGVAQGDARQDAERGTKGQGRPFVTAPGAAPEGGNPAAGGAGCRGALLFGYFLLGKQEKVTRRKGEKGKIRFTQWFRK